MARYGRGEYFGAHHDAFPTEVAQAKGYQRIATLLLYLNDVGEGGATVFGRLPAAGGEGTAGAHPAVAAALTGGPGLGFRPRRGDGVLFFPCGRGGLLAPDADAVHEAAPAVDEKWVSQVWVSVGVGPAAEPAAEGGGGPMSKAARRRMQKQRGRKR